MYIVSYNIASGNLIEIILNFKKKPINSHGSHLEFRVADRLKMAFSRPADAATIDIPEPLRHLELQPKMHLELDFLMQHLPTL